MGRLSPPVFPLVGFIRERGNGESGLVHPDLRDVVHGFTSASIIHSSIIGNIFPANESQSVSCITSPFAMMLRDGNEGEQFDIRSVENHRKCAQIVYVAAYVGVEVEFGHGDCLRS